jgi:hypothetical protein
MFITIPGDSLWSVYTEDKAPRGLYHGGGDDKSPRAVRKNAEGQYRLKREKDFKIVFDEVSRKNIVYPDPTLGLSFSSTVERLQRLGIRGKVWRLPRKARLPDGLMINYNDITHPLINVAYKMPVEDLIEKLKQLEALMENTGILIK